MNKKLPNSSMCSSFSLNDNLAKWTCQHQQSDIGSLRFSPDGKSLAITCFKGEAYIRNSSRSRILAQFQVSEVESPILSVRWNTKNQDQLIFSAANGSISSWSIKDQKKLWSVCEKGNTVNSIDISPQGDCFVSVGSDSVVRVYDIETHQLKTILATTSYMQGVVTGHTNRVFATFYINDNLVASGGWDNTVILWDLRQGSAARSIFGPSICGDAINVVNQGKTLVTGSWRDSKQLQFWDVSSGNCEKSIDVGAKPNQVNVYAIAVTPNQQFVACAGSSTNRSMFYRVSDYALVYQTGIQPSEVTDIHFSSRQFAYGLADSTVFVDYYKMK